MVLRVSIESTVQGGFFAHDFLDTLDQMSRFVAGMSGRRLTYRDLVEVVGDGC